MANVFWALPAHLSHVCLLALRQLKHKKRSIKTMLINKKQERKDELRKKERELQQCTTSSAVLHKRMCTASFCYRENGIEKGNSEFAYLGKTSQWRQSISKSVLLKRARQKYSSSQHKRRWHTSQSFGYSQCAGNVLLRSICLKLLQPWRHSSALWSLTIRPEKSNYV